MLALSLLQNLALLVALSTAYRFVLRRQARQPTLRLRWQVLLGLLFGAAGIIAMMAPVVYRPGIIFDGRTIILSLAGLFGGPLAVAIAAPLCAGYRLWLGGGGAPVGVATIVMASALGLILHILRRRRGLRLRTPTLWAFGLLTHALMLALFFLLPEGAGPAVMADLGPTILALYPVAFTLIALLFLDEEAHQAAQAALRESERRYRQLVENIPGAAVLRFDGERRVTFVGGSLIDRTGLSRSALIGRRPEDFAPPETVAQFDPALRAALAGEERSCEVHSSNGTVYLVNLSPLRDAAGPGALVVALDETAHARARAERDALGRRLQENQRLEAIGRLAGGVAHDFNNILQAILGYTELLLLRTPPSDSRHADLREIRSAAERSAELTRQLLAFARRQPIQPRPIDLHASLAGMRRLLQRLLGEEITLEWLAEEGLWPVQMDPSQLDQILVNLLTNARDAGARHILIEAANVTLDAAAGPAAPPDLPAGDYVLLSVSDDGHGMDAETLAHIFEPFFSTKAPPCANDECAGGTGLGLATVYGIIQQNGGNIHVSSAPGRGSTFRLYLPRAQVTPGAPAEPVPPPPEGHETILLVEDDARVRALDRLLLEGLGYRVLTAATPTEALRLAETHAGAIDLLITDVILPEMNGRQLAEALQARRPGLRVLYMSGYTPDVIFQHGVLEEGMHFLAKPFARRDLATKVRQALAAG